MPTPDKPLTDDGCLCQNCGRRYKVDVTVPDDIWERIKPKGKPPGGGLLCGACVVARVEDLEEFVVSELRSYRRPAPVSDEAMLERALAWLQNHGGTRAL